MRNLVIVATILVIAGAVWFQTSISAKSNLAEFKNFEILEGESLDTISKRLEDARLIKSSLAFRILAAVKGKAEKIQAGSFSLSASQTADQILSELLASTADVWITIPEGWRLTEIGQYLEQKLGLAREEFVKVAREGFMFPDTYSVPKKSTASDIAKIMLDNFGKKVDLELENKIKSAGLNLDQAIIFASIIERETKFEKDRPIVAGILLKRWREGLPLEADATVQYAAGYQSTEFSWWKKTLQDSDLKIDSPYNTRKFTGLPPGPICNPGLSSVKAVAEPAKTSYYYYVSDNEGHIHYAKDLDEHIENIRNYL